MLVYHGSQAYHKGLQGYHQDIQHTDPAEFSVLSSFIKLGKMTKASAYVLQMKILLSLQMAALHVIHQLTYAGSFSCPATLHAPNPIQHQPSVMNEAHKNKCVST